MANDVKNYFLAPSWDYPPNGPIALGNIIRAPDKVVPPLYAHKKSDSDPPLIPSYKEDVEWSKEKAVEGKFGIWTKFLQELGLSLGVDVGVNFKNVDEKVYSFKRMDTEEFFPDDDDFIRNAMKTLAVKSYLEKSRFQRSVYMVVGVKRVTGASVKSALVREHGGELNVGVDGLLTGAPMSFGPQAALNLGHKENTSFGASSDFVFAYRLRKIKVNRKDVVKQDDYNRGALFEDKTSEAVAAETFTVEGLDDRDASAEDFGVQEDGKAADDNENVSISKSKKTARK